MDGNLRLGRFGRSGRFRQANVWLGNVCSVMARKGKGMAGADSCGGAVLGLDGKSREGTGLAGTESHGELGRSTERSGLADFLLTSHGRRVIVFIERR